MFLEAIELMWRDVVQQRSKILPDPKAAEQRLVFHDVLVAGHVGQVLCNERNALLHVGQVLCNERNVLLHVGQVLGMSY